MTDNLQGLKIGNDNVEFRVLCDDGNGKQNSVIF